jgi:hypothetical protein
VESSDCDRDAKNSTVMPAISHVIAQRLINLSAMLGDRTVAARNFH